MNKIIISLIITFIVITSTYASTIIFTGQITELSSVGEITAPDSIVAGLNYTATLEYDTSFSRDLQSADRALYFSDYILGMQVEFDDGHFMDSIYSTWVRNDYNGYDSLVFLEPPTDIALTL